jgi:hypothetical protein
MQQLYYRLCCGLAMFEVEEALSGLFVKTAKEELSHKLICESKKSPTH